jgi:hypothetical protein
MWNIKCIIIPVIIGATVRVAEGLKEDLEAIPRERAIDSLQKHLRMEYNGDNV